MKSTNTRFKRIHTTRLAILALAAFGWGFAAAAPTRAADVYKIDPAHSSVGFKIRHFFSKVQGRYDTFEGEIRYNPENPAASSVRVAIETASINTGTQKRDTHLRSADFFNVEKFPRIVFESTGVEATGANAARITGDIEIHGVKKTVVLDAKLLGKATDMEGKVRTGWEATTTLNRKDFGLEYGSVVEGVAVIGDEVEIELQVEAVLQSAAVAAE